MTCVHPLLDNESKKNPTTTSHSQAGCIVIPTDCVHSDHMRCLPPFRAPEGKNKPKFEKKKEKKRGNCLENEQLDKAGVEDSSSQIVGLPSVGRDGF